MFTIYSNAPSEKLHEKEELTAVLNGSACATKELFIAEAKRNRLVRENCGLNWDAFEEALIDTLIENLTVKCIVRDAHLLLSEDETRALDTLLDIFSNAGSTAQSEVKSDLVTFVWSFWTPSSEPGRPGNTFESRCPFIYQSDRPISF